MQSTLRRAVADFVLALKGTQSKLYAAVVQRFPRGGARSQTMSDRMSANICGLGHLEGKIAAVVDDLCTDLDQRPGGELPFLSRRASNRQR